MHNLIKIKFDINIMKFISLFESITRASVKDCIEQSKKLIFIVNENQISKAIGKRGLNIKKLEKLLNKKVKVIEYSNDLLQFTQNTLFPQKVKEISEEEGIITITPPDSKTRGMLIGHNAQNLRNTEEIVKRYFPIKEIKVI